MTRFLLIRHGESEWNAKGRWQGQADPPLTSHGLLQAHHAARRLGAVDAVVASTLQRAQHTAETISEALGVGPVQVDSRLMERDAAEWSGLTRAEIIEAWPGYLIEDRTSAIVEKRPPGWETDESLIERSTAALHELAESFPDAEVVVVTHGGVMYALEAHLGAPRQYIPNLGARWLNVAGGRVELGERVELLDASMNQRSTGTDRSAI